MGKIGSNRFAGTAYHPLAYVNKPWNNAQNNAFLREKGYADDVSSRVSAETRAKLKQSHFTEEEYIRASKSIASYTIVFAMHEQHMAVKFMIDKLRQHALNTFKGYKVMLNRLEQYDKHRHTAEIIGMGSDYKRISVMCPIIHEDMEQNLERMYYTAMNYYHRWKHPEAEIMAAAQMAQLVTDFTVNIIHARVAEIRRMCPQFMPLVEDVKPVKVRKMIEDVMHRIVQLCGDCGDDFDINNCRELHYGIHCMEEIVSDVDRMELYTAYGIEQTEGKYKLRESCPEAYYKLHPMEDPEYLAQKEARELEAINQQEQEDAAPLAYTTRDIEEAEAREGMTLEEMFAQKGWNVKNPA